MTPKLKRVLIAACIVAVAVGAAVAYRVFQAQNANAVARSGPRTAPAVPVIASKVDQRAMPVRLRAIGTVQAMHTVAVRARLDSQITEVLVTDGQNVKAGQPLFRLDSRQIVAQLEQARAVLERDQAQLAFAQRQLERKQPQISSEAAIDEARTNFMALQASVSADRAVLENLTVQRSYTSIAAPIAGRLGTVAYKAGSIVKTTDPQPLVTINQLRPVYVAFSLPQSALGHVQAALAAGPVPAEAILPGGGEQSESGHVSYVENSVDASTGTISVKAEFPNEAERLWPGAYVNVEITLRTEQDALVVPARSIQVGQEGTYVFVIHDDDTVQAQPVTLDRTVGEDTVLTGGVSAGQRIVVEGQLRLVNGTKVEARPLKPETRQ
jgi:membrane fusion protein, multidrug efflux system